MIALSLCDSHLMMLLFLVLGSQFRFLFLIKHFIKIFVSHFVIHFLTEEAFICTHANVIWHLFSFQALDTFNAALVSPVYYVMFTTLTIIASIIMFKVIT